MLLLSFWEIWENVRELVNTGTLCRTWIFWLYSTYLEIWIFQYDSSLNMFKPMTTTHLNKKPRKQVGKNIGLFLTQLFLTSSHMAFVVVFFGALHYKSTFIVWRAVAWIFFFLNILISVSNGMMVSKWQTCEFWMNYSFKAFVCRSRWKDLHTSFHLLLTGIAIAM